MGGRTWLSAVHVNALKVDLEGVVEVELLVAKAAETWPGLCGLQLRANTDSCKLQTAKIRVKREFLNGFSRLREKLAPSQCWIWLCLHLGAKLAPWHKLAHMLVLKTSPQALAV
jgi:hypothetical protein